MKCQRMWNFIRVCTVLLLRYKQSLGAEIHFNFEILTRFNLSIWIMNHHKFIVLTLCILMDFPVHIDAISMGLPIVYF